MGDVFLTVYLTVSITFTYEVHSKPCKHIMSPVIDVKKCSHGSVYIRVLSGFYSEETIMPRMTYCCRLIILVCAGAMATTEGDLIHHVK